MIRYTIHYLLTISLCLCISCAKDQEINPPILISLEGTWQFEQGILDSKEDEEWDVALMTIEMIEDSTLFTSCTDQPQNRKNIWPNESQLMLQNTDPIFKFIRDDGIHISVSLIDDALTMTMQPPRQWSYSEECPNDENLLVCSEGGVWQFVLIE